MIFNSNFYRVTHIDRKPNLLIYYLIILSILTISSGLFYTHGLPFYVLGELREGSIDDWVKYNFVIASLIVILTIIRSASKRATTMTISLLVIICFCLILLHIPPLVLYMDTMFGDWIIRDDTSTEGPRAKISIAILHVIIILLSIKSITGLFGDILKTRE